MFVQSLCKIAQVHKLIAAEEIGKIAAWYDQRRITTAPLTPYRKSAFDKFFANRGQGTDRRPGARRDPDVQVNMDANSRRYPDRQEAGYHS